jgi:hypothetical protein
MLVVMLIFCMRTLLKNVPVQPVSRGIHHPSPFHLWFSPPQVHMFMDYGSSSIDTAMVPSITGTIIVTSAQVQLWFLPP